MKTTTTPTPTTTTTTTFLLIVLGILQVASVAAWGKMGHELVGNVAWELLDRTVQDDIVAILENSKWNNENNKNNNDNNDNNDDKKNHLSPLGAVADWADQVRHSHNYTWSAPLHYIDIRDTELPSSCWNINHTTTTTTTTKVSATAASSSSSSSSCDFVWTRDCAKNRCVVGALQNYTARLVDFVHENAAEQEALKFITHFVGDLHQPLHVSKTSDRGGNQIPVHVQFAKTMKKQQDPPAGSSIDKTTYYYYLRTSSSRATTVRRTTMTTTALQRTTDSNGNQNDKNQNLHHHYPTNLHSVWDDVLLETYQKQECANDWRTLQAVLVEVIDNATHSGAIDDWVACADGGRVVCLTAWAQESWYAARTAAYVHATNGTQIQPHDVLPRAYYETNLPLVLEQLAKAAVRLAWTLTFHLSSRRRSHSVGMDTY